jgi:hypothetical protein
MRSQSHLPEHVSSPTPQGYQCHLPSPLPTENSCFSQPRCCSMPSLSFFSKLILKLDANKSNSRVALHQTNPITSHYCHSDHSTPQHPVRNRRLPLHPSSPNACDLHWSILICLQGLTHTGSRKSQNKVDSQSSPPPLSTGVFWFVCRVSSITDSGNP